MASSMHFGNALECHSTYYLDDTLRRIDLQNASPSRFMTFLRRSCCYDGSNWTDLLPQVEFAYTANRTLGIEHTPSEDNFDFSHEEPLDLQASMRPSIPVSEDASKRLKLLQELHAI
jgi:hypothetical protein